jgi:Flp pilus assembly pilin Flp
MKLLNIFKSFKNDESGAVTVDWVVLTAAIVGLGIAVTAAIGPQITNASNQIATDLTNAATR